MSREVVEDQILGAQKHFTSEVQRGHQIINIAGFPVSPTVSRVTCINVRTWDLSNSDNNRHERQKILHLAATFINIGPTVWALLCSILSVIKRQRQA